MTWPQVRSGCAVFHSAKLSIAPGTARVCTPADIRQRQLFAHFCFGALLHATGRGLGGLCTAGFVWNPTLGIGVVDRLMSH
jgi:hypothetical protein